MNPLLRKLLRELGADPQDRASVPGPSDHERFALPYSFKPQLTLTQALVSVVGAFLRILLGSILFGVWGTYTLLAWSAIHNVVLRVVVLLVLLAVFLILFAALMVGIATLVEKTLSKFRPS